MVPSLPSIQGQRRFYALTSITPATGIALPLSAGAPPAEFLVPTESDLLLAAAHGSAPITFLFVDDYQAPAGSANELAAIPYRYQVGTPASGHGRHGAGH